MVLWVRNLERLGEVVLAQAAIGRSWNRKAGVSPCLSILSQGLPRTSTHWPVLAALQQGAQGMGCSVEAGDLQSVHSRTGGRCVAFSGLALQLYTDVILLGTGRWVRGHTTHVLWRDQRTCKGLEVAHLVKSKMLRRPGVQGSCRNRQG